MTSLHSVPTHIIEKALALTGRTMEDTQEAVWVTLEGYSDVFSIEKFGWYLLSPEFVEKYAKIAGLKYEDFGGYGIYDYIFDYAVAIHEYQSGNPKTLISLLEKIG